MAYKLSPPQAALAAIAFLTSTLAHTQDGVQYNVPGAGFDTPALTNAPTDAPTIHVYSRETILDVLVTDAAGHPVRGLKQSDFTITEDGHPQAIRSFSETTASAPTPSPSLPAHTYTNANNLPANGPVQIFYVNLACPPLNIWIAKYIGDYLRTMPAGTQVAIFGFRADLGLRLVQGFTTDGPLAAAAINNLSLPVCKTPSADPIAAANEIAAYVAGIHGRKNLIWFGTPLPDILRDGGLAWHPERAPDMTLVHRLMDTYARFTEEQIAIYPFDAGGVRARSPGDASILRSENIAGDTGGAAIFNTNDFESPIAKIVNDTEHYYTLSYVPPRLVEDAHYHPIKITVSRPGLRLAYRGGYNSEQLAPPDNILKIHMSQASMGLASLPATQIVFSAKVEPSAPSAAPPARKSLALAGKQPVPYDTLFTIPPDQISFSQSSDGKVYYGSIEFDLAAYDSYGKIAAIRSQTLKLPLTAEEHQDFEAHPFQFYLPIDIPVGKVTLRLGVFDTTADRSGTFEIPIANVKPNPVAIASTPTP